MAYPSKLQDVVDTLALVPDRGDRIEMLISIADRFREVPESIAQRPFAETQKVPACESEAFVWAEQLADSTLKFHFAVENPQGMDITFVMSGGSDAMSFELLSLMGMPFRKD